MEYLVDLSSLVKNFGQKRTLSSLFIFSSVATESLDAFRAVFRAGSCPSLLHPGSNGTAIVNAQSLTSVAVI